MTEPDPATSEFPEVERRGRGPGLYDEERHPGQRTKDKPWRYWPGWIMRHIVPAAAIIVAAFAVHAASGASSKAEQNAKKARELSAANRRTLVVIQQGRRAAIGESCVQDERIADVVRKALLGFGVGQPGHPAPRAVAKAFQPLGGLKPLTAKKQKARCDARVRRGGGP
jgi:hypothetical protein